MSHAMIVRGKNDGYGKHGSGNGRGDGILRNLGPSLVGSHVANPVARIQMLLATIVGKRVI